MSDHDDLWPAPPPHERTNLPRTPDREAEEEAAWVTLAQPIGGGTHLRVSRRHGRWAVDAVYVHHPDGVTASDLQEIPISQLTLVMNLVAKSLEALQELTTKSGFIGIDEPIELLPLLPDPSADVSTATLRRQTDGAPHVLGIIDPLLDERPKLTRPDGSDPDTFYALVARAYAQYAQKGRAPAVDIAHEADVPVATVRSWVREARRRGHLPPGRKGKAG